MRWMPRQVDHLIAGSVLFALLGIWVVLTGFDAITALAAEMDEVGEGNYGFAQTLIYTAWTIPRRAYTLFPTAAVVGSLLGLGTLAASSELTALRAMGLSRIRICLPAMGLVFTMTLLMVLVGETIGPLGEQRAQTLALQAKTSDSASSTRSGLWAREGNTFLNARHGSVLGRGADARIELTGVSLYEFDDEGRLLSIATAGRAEHNGGGWMLHELRRSRFGERQVQSETVAQEPWNSSLSPDVLKLGVTRPRYLPLPEVRRSLEYLQRNELDALEFENAYWSRLFYPLSALLLCGAAMPFAFGSLRSGGFGKRLFVGIVFGVGAFTLQTLAVNLASAYHLDLRLAYVLPPLMVALASWLHFRRKT